MVVGTPIWVVPRKSCGGKESRVYRFVEVEKNENGEYIDNLIVNLLSMTDGTSQCTEVSPKKHLLFIWKQQCSLFYNCNTDVVINGVGVIMLYTVPNINV